MAGMVRVCSAFCHRVRHSDKRPGDCSQIQINPYGGMLALVMVV